MAYHEAEEYTLSVRREVIEGEIFYVARVEELPDVQEYSESYEEARELALDTIRTSQRIYDEQRRSFPEPKSFEEPLFSGRITLRLRKTTHAEAAKRADEEGVSLNSFISSCVERECSSVISNDLELQIKQLRQLMIDVYEESSITSTTLSSYSTRHNQEFRHIEKAKLTVIDDGANDSSAMRLFLAKQDIRYAYD